MEIFWKFFFFSFLPISVMFSSERFLLYYLEKTENRKLWVRNQFWLHPNFISRCRYPMGIVSVFFYYLGDHDFGFAFKTLGVLWFSFWIISDVTDGTIARKFDLDSPEGAVIDPFSDKLLYFPPLFYLVYLGILPFYGVLAFLALDITGQFSRYFIENKAANLFGKAKTFLTVITLVVAFLQQIYLPELVSERPDLFRIPELFLWGTLLLGFFSMFFKITPNYWYANVLSIMNLLCGLAGILLVILGYEGIFAFALVFLGQFLDLFDGRAAERWGSTPRGELLDDLADGTNFGGSISIIIYISFQDVLLGIIMSILHFTCTVYRLIRFLSDKKKSGIEGGVSYFSGLPSPAAGLLSGSVVLLFGREIFADFYINVDYLKIGFIVLSSVLMVSKIRYIHFGRKILPNIPNMIKVLVLTFVVMIILIAPNLRNQTSILASIFIISSTYLFFGHLWKRL